MKKKSRKLLSLLMCIILVLTSLFALGINSASAATAGQAGSKATWQYNTSTKTLTIAGTGATNDFGSVTNRVPWNSYTSEIENVVVGNGITELGRYCFYKCTALKNVSLPSTLTRIGGLGTMTASYGCFQNCTALESITLPEGLETIENCAFKDCTSLKSITLPNTLKTLSYGAFSGCTSLASVTFGTGLTETGYMAFYNCTALKSIIWGGIEKVSSYSFYGFFGSSIEFPESITSIGFRSFAENYNIRNVTIHNPDCEIVTSEATEQVSPFAGHQQDVTIYGHTGSTAQTFASTYNYKFVSLDPCDHTETEDVVAEEASCTKTGTLQKVCKNCGQIVSSTEIEALGHEYSVIESVDYTEVDGHIYSTEKCSRCDDIKDVIEHARTGNVSPRYVWVEGYYNYTNSATCTRPGVERYVCTVDGCYMTVGSLETKQPTQETINASLGNHSVNEWKVEKEATCTEAGLRKGKCSVCGADVEEDIPPTGHVYSNAEDSPDLVTIVTAEESEDGHNYYFYQCHDCTEQAVEMEHVDWIDGKYSSRVISEAHCVVNGLRIDTCDICATTRNVTLPANGQHEWYETSRTEPSCSVTGQIYYACRNCTMTRTERTEALGHDYEKVEENSKLPTCTTGGYDFEKCSRCPATRQVTIPATGHTVDPDNYTIIADATCEETGKALSVCTVCSEGFETSIDALGHNFVDNVVDLTSENKPGHSLVTPVCSRCRTRQAATMRHDEWLENYYTSEETLQSTCSIQGFSTDTCTICNTTRRNYYSALGHNYNYVGDNDFTSSALAGVTYEGMLYRCSICQRTRRIKTDYVLACWNSSYVNSRDIERTGSDSEILNITSLLDANGDGIINAKDYALIKRCDRKQKELIEFEKLKTYASFSIGGNQYMFEIVNNEAGNSFAQMLPLTLTMTDVGGNSKQCTLENTVSTENTAYETIRIASAGDVLLTKNNELRIFYKASTVSGEFIRLGKLDDTSNLQENLGTDDVELVIDVIERQF